MRSREEILEEMMSYHQHVYKIGHIVKRFQWDSFKKIPKKDLVAVVINVLPNSKKDQEVLKLWEDHFRQDLPIAGLPEPYVITQNPETGIKMLWKRRRRG
jgi:hypothetical protein